jgi:hypothetical protein
MDTPGGGGHPDCVMGRPITHHPECPAEQMSGLAYVDPSRFCECEPCDRCDDEGYVEEDQPDPNIGWIATRRVCPDCEGTKRRLT